ncbi:hypothetical protein LOAG_00031 [Loa loa]|uniref:Uncharacterized protein n=1 Tax=Loa loa TaxID=7209 RepID=A0A1S0UCB9_LOALO|nr:hypothetical protein LOAG_00031 [Loa loa]EFO28435.2 hypothetical protein LOAG_00031 [Loa loa]
MNSTWATIRQARYPKSCGRPRDNSCPASEISETVLAGSVTIGDDVVMRFTFPGNNGTGTNHYYIIWVFLSERRMSRVCVW